MTFECEWYPCRVYGGTAESKRSVTHQKEIRNFWVLPVSLSSKRKRTPAVMYHRKLLASRTYRVLCSLIYTCKTLNNEVSTELVFPSGGVLFQHLPLPFKSLLRHSESFVHVAFDSCVPAVLICETRRGDLKEHDIL